MGIDARILIRYKGEYPSDEQLNHWSWDLCAAIGARYFWIEDGVPPEEYELSRKKWHEAFESHPLYCQYNVTPRPDQEVGNVIRGDIGPSPKALRRAIELTNRLYPLDDSDEDIPESHRKPGFAYLQDGPEILAEPGEVFLAVSLYTRYYGIGYERGDILTLRAIAEWIEANMQPCGVWYGGDSSGVCAEPFTPEYRAKLVRHLYSPDGRDYFVYEPRGTFETPPPCGLCVPGENRFNRHGWGGRGQEAYIAVSCAGCGKNFSKRGSSEWTEEKDEK